jgi:hypothetical protein
MTYIRLALASMLGIPLCVFALDQRERPVQSLVVMPAPTSPAEVTDGRSGALRLREALRQPATDGDGLGKPYRLTPEERQRLREQLRGQTTTEASREK